MSNGGLYFFQAGTAELVEEWVSTCNYWAARMSKEPLPGGVSNMEYGWGRCLEQLNEIGVDFDVRSVKSDPRSISSNNSTYIGDRIIINEWKTPIPPSVSSTHDEVTIFITFFRLLIGIFNINTDTFRIIIGNATCGTEKI